MPRIRLGRALPLVCFSAVVCTALGALAGFAVRPVAVPADLAAAPALQQAPVTRQTFDDQRTVKVRFAMSRSTTLSSPGEGTVTTSRCRAGRLLRSGQSLGRLDDTPVLALATSVPLYRDLSSGSRGRDVRSLQAELRRLGLETKETGYYGSLTRSAVRTLQKRAGAASPTGLITLDRVAWLPRRTVRPTGCDAKVGDKILPGAAWVRVSGGLAAVTITRPAGSVSGARTLELYGQRVRLGKKVTTVDPVFLSRVEATRDFAAYRREGGDGEVTGTVTLSKPLDTLKVPPAALFGIDGRHACLENGDQVIPVKLVGSGLGASLVTAATPVDSVDLGDAIGAARCAEGS